MSLTTAESNQQAVAAYQLGIQACEQGRSSVPAQDAALLQLIDGNLMGESLPALTAWNQGWHEVQRQQANMAVAALEARWAAEELAEQQQAGQE